MAMFHHMDRHKLLLFNMSLNNNMARICLSPPLATCLPSLKRMSRAAGCQLPTTIETNLRLSVAAHLDLVGVLDCTHSLLGCCPQHQPGLGLEGVVSIVPPLDGKNTDLTYEERFF
jgi:hypothetical protein